MGDIEKVFIFVIGRLGCYFVVGGMVIWWEFNGVYIDFSLNLYDRIFKLVFEMVVNNVIVLVCVIYKVGVFKCCMFNVKNILYIECEYVNYDFIFNEDCCIFFEIF